MSNQMSPLSNLFMTANHSSNDMTAFKMHSDQYTNETLIVLQTLTSLRRRTNQNKDSHYPTSSQYGSQAANTNVYRA